MSASDVECAPRIGQDQAAFLTGVRALSLVIDGITDGVALDDTATHAA
jgi:hypothetical protein